MSRLIEAVEAKKKADVLENEATRDLAAFISDEIEKATGRKNDRLARWLTAVIAQREMAATE